MPQPRRSSQLTPAGIALRYAVFAALWLSVSDSLLTAAVNAPLLHNHSEIALGLLCVAVTSALVFMLARRLATSGGRIDHRNA